MTDDIYFEADDTEEGVYEATLTEIARKTSAKDGETFLVWNFKTPEGKALSGSSSVSGHVKSKGMKWAKAILGRELANTEPLSALYGKPCLVAVEMNANGYPKVADVHPSAPKRAMTAPAVTPPPAGAPEPTDWADVTEEQIPF
jgi:hypothetical protein